MFASQAAVSALPLVVANKSTTTKRDVTRRRLHPHAATRSGIACQSLGRSAPKLAKNPSMATPSRPHARFGASQSRGSSAFAPRASASAAATEGGKAQEPSGISYFTSNVRADVLAGLTVALALVPEALAFTFVAGVHPLVGLHGAILMCGVTALLGGRPGMISGAAGATAVVTGTLVAEHGPSYLFACMIMAGVLQIAFGVARLGKLIRLVPRAAMLGFVNGLAIVILSAQAEHFQTLNAAGEIVWMTGQPACIMVGLTLLSIAIIEFLPKITKAIPGPLAAIGAVTCFVQGLGIETDCIGDLATIKGTLPAFSVPHVPFEINTLSIVMPFAVAVAAVGLIETLLTQNLVDEMTQTRSDTSKESMAQGLGNVVNGFFNGMGGCAMIGQTMINMNSGGRGRLSGLTCAAAIAAFVVVLSSQIEKIPLAALVGVMVKVVMDTFAWESLVMMKKIPKTDVVVLVSVTLTTVVCNLAVAVIAGVIISALGFAYKQSKQVSAKRSVEEIEGRDTAVYSLSGPLFFGSVMQLKGAVDPASEDLGQVVLDFEDCKVWDQSALEAITAISERFAERGVIVRMRRLSDECRVLVDKAADLVEVETLEDRCFKDDKCYMG